MATLKNLCADLDISIRSVQLLGPMTKQATKWIGARHYQVEISVEDKPIYLGPYSQGSACVAPPALTEVLYCLLSDADTGGQSYRDWANEAGFGLDSVEGRRVFSACEDTREALIAAFGSVMFEELLDAMRNE
jgi:hypothetical protein